MNREGKSGVGMGQCVACRRSVPWDLAMGLQQDPQSLLLSTDLQRSVGPDYTHSAHSTGCLHLAM